MQSVISRQIDGVPRFLDIVLAALKLVQVASLRIDLMRRSETT